MTASRIVYSTPPVPSNLCRVFVLRNDASKFCQNGARTRLRNAKKLEIEMPRRREAFFRNSTPRANFSFGGRSARFARPTLWRSLVVPFAQSRRHRWEALLVGSEFVECCNWKRVRAKSMGGSGCKESFVPVTRRERLAGMYPRAGEGGESGRSKIRKASREIERSFKRGEGSEARVSFHQWSTIRIEPKRTAEQRGAREWDDDDQPMFKPLRSSSSRLSRIQPSFESTMAHIEDDFAAYTTLGDRVAPPSGSSSSASAATTATRPAPAGPKFGVPAKLEVSQCLLLDDQKSGGGGL